MCVFESGTISRYLVAVLSVLDAEIALFRHPAWFALENIRQDAVSKDMKRQHTPQSTPPTFIVSPGDQELLLPQDINVSI